MAAPSENHGRCLRHQNKAEIFILIFILVLMHQLVLVLVRVLVLEII